MMKKILFPSLFLWAVCLPSHADITSSLVKIHQATAMIDKVQQISEKYQSAFGSEAQINLNEYVPVPEPRTDNAGKYMLPYDDLGISTEWADKALNAQAGAAAGGVAADKAVDALVSKVPLGGLFAGSAKKKGKEMAAVAAIGGWEFIKETSSLSFDSLDDYSVYLHMTHSGEDGYDQALAAAMAIYPKLEKSYSKTLSKVYRSANKAAKKDI